MGAQVSQCDFCFSTSSPRHLSSPHHATSTLRSAATTCSVSSIDIIRYRQLLPSFDLHQLPCATGILYTYLLGSPAPSVPSRAGRLTRSNGEHSHLAHILANCEDGLGAFGNISVWAQYSLQGMSYTDGFYSHTRIQATQLIAQKTGHNPFLVQQPRSLFGACAHLAKARQHSPRSCTVSSAYICKSHSCVQLGWHALISS